MTLPKNPKVYIYVIPMYYMELKEIIKQKKDKMITARVSAETKTFIKSNNIHIGTMIEKTIKELKRK